MQQAETDDPKCLQRLGYLDLETIYTIVQQHCSQTDFRQFFPPEQRQGPVTQQWHIHKTAKKAALELLSSLVIGRRKIRVATVLVFCESSWLYQTIANIEIKNYSGTSDNEVFSQKCGSIKFQQGGSLDYSFDYYNNCIITKQSHAYTCFFNIFDMLNYGGLSIPYNDVIAYYQEHFGYNPQQYIDEYNNQKYQEWLKWRNQDPVGIFPGMSAANLHQLYETNDLNNEELTRTPWSPEQVLTVDSYDI